ncbi:hypothetical protein ACPXCX_53610, partial [Streptomyces sp. DT225]
LVLAAACVYYLVADVRFYARLTGKAAGFPHAGPGYAYVTTVPTPPYGQPQPYPPHPGQQHPSRQHPYPLPLTRCPQPEDARPAPQHPAPPQRIDQVRAELDELSDYLRKEEGR